MGLWNWTGVGGRVEMVLIDGLFTNHDRYIG